MLSRTVIPSLDKILSENDIPHEIRTDNGPPFYSKDFNLLADYLGFKHRKVTPYWPRTNGEAERFMRTVKKAIKAALVEEKNWKQISKFLRNYRATPHASTDTTCQALDGRNLKTRLPEALTIQEADRKTKEQMERYSDKKANVKSSNTNPGDPVLV